MADRETIRGATRGYKRGEIFELTNGRKWEQTSTEYDYHYQYAPEVTVEDNGYYGRLKIDNMNHWVEVKRVS